MAGTTHVDVSDVVKGLNDLQRRGRDLRPVWKRIRPLFRDDLKSHRAGPSGPWPGPARSTIEKVRRRKGSTYKRGKRAGQLTKRGTRRLNNPLGKLKGAWKFRSFRHEISGASPVKWAGVHNAGGIAGRGARIPKRTIAWVSTGLATVATTQIRDYILEAW